MPYVIVYAGELESAQVWENREIALSEAQCIVNQYICDFLRHNLPMKITPEEARRFDVKVYEIKEEMELPFQKWVDEYYDEMRMQEIKDEERDYKRFLELYERFKDRIPE